MGKLLLVGYNENGTVYKVKGSGKERVLYRFRGTDDNSTPLAGVIRDSPGNL
jgi:hypothetical protein